MKYPVFLSWKQADQIRLALWRNLRQKLTFAFLSCLLFWHYSLFLFQPVLAASSPWTQTDWSGGSGQTSWSDTTKYDSASSVTTSTAGVATLSTGSEKVSNVGFESDLSSWSQSSEGTTSSFPDSTYAAESGAVAAWPLDDTTTTQSYSRVVNPALTAGRNLYLDSDMETSGVTNWGAINSATITKQTTSPHGGTQVLRVARNGVNAAATRQSVTTAGKSYRITGWVRSDGTAIPLITTNSGGTTIWTGTTSTSWQSVDVTYVVVGADFRLTTSASVDAQYVEWDDMSITQTDLPAYNSASPSQLLADGTMEAAGTSSWTAQANATLSKQTSSPHGGSQVLRIARSSSAGPNAKQDVLTIGQHYRISGYLRSDGSATPRVWTNAGSTILFSGTTSTSWQPFDVSFVAVSTDVMIGTNTNTGTQYAEFDDVIVARDTFIRPGELLQDNDMEASGTGVWVTTGTVSKQTSSPHGGSQVLRVTSASGNVYADQLSGSLGRTYRVTGYARGDGSSAAPIVSNAGGTSLFTGTTSTSWQFFDTTMIATTTEVAKFRTSATGYTEWDDLSIQEINPLVGLPTNGVTLGSTANGHLTNSYTFDGTNDIVNIYSTDFNSAFNQAEGTAVVWAKVSAAGDWTDAATRRILYIPVDSNNRLFINKTATTNQISAVYQAGGTSSTVSSTALAGSTGWFQVALSWSKSNDQVKVYINGSQVGSTQTGLGTWVGNLSATSTLIGSDTNSGGNAWKGQINDVRIYNRALSGSEVSTLYSGNTFTRDTVTFHGGVASAKVVTDAFNNANVTQSINVGDTNNYNFVTYAYTNGTAVSSADVQLYYNGAAITTDYTSVGSGWYRLSAVITGANASRTFGVQVKPSKTIYVDDFSVTNYSTSGTLTSSIFDTGQASNWGTLTFNALTPTSTTATVKVRTSNDSGMSGATAFSSCSTVSSGVDLSGASCATDNQRYVQYQVGLGTSDTSVTSTFQDISIAFASADTAPPTGGSISYTDGYYTTASVSLTVSDGTDAGVGVDTSTRTVQRKSATLSAGSCGSYGSFSTITPTGSYPSYTDTTVSTGNCYQYQYLVSDLNGNQATYTVSNTAKVDTGSPSAPGTPSTTSPTNSATQNWTWTAATDAVSSIASYLWRTTGTAITSGSTATNSVMTSLAQGVYTFFVKAVDGAGNQSSETSNTVTVDTTAPTTTDNTDSSWHTSAVTITLSCNDSGGTSCANTYYTTDGTTPTTGSSSGTTITLSSDGVYTIKYFSRDTVGNSESVKTAANTVKIDSVNPTTPGTPSTTSPTTNSTPTWSWTAASDATAGLASPPYTVQWSTDNTFLSGVSSSTASTNSFTHSTALASGTWYFRVKAADAAGNQSSYSSAGSVVVNAAVATDTTPPLAFTLDSPGDKEFTNNTRPTFKWKSTTDAGSGMNKYVLEVDNPTSGGDQPAGDFTVDNIPPTSDSQVIDTNKYTIRYENGSISVTTKSSNDWGNTENSGQLREGVINWKVKAVDNSGNEQTASRTLFVDQTAPTVSLTQLNDVAVSSSNFATTDKTPTFFGRVTDQLAGTSQNQAQTDDGPKVASGPKQVTIKVEKKNGLIYTVFSEANVTLNTSYFSCDSQQISDNTKLRCDKYSPFSYTLPNSLSEGSYRATLIGKDNLDQTSSEQVFTLTVSTLNAIASVPEKEVIKEEIAQLPVEQQQAVEEQIEVTKPVASATPAPVIKQVEKVAAQQQNILAEAGKLFFTISSSATNVFKSAFEASGNAIAWISQGIANGAQSLANATGGGISSAMTGISQAFSSASVALRNSTRETADRMALSTIGFLYRFVSEPTQIYEVRVTALSPTEAKITWKTNIPANGKVNFGFDETYPFDIQSEERTTDHQFILKNLKPNTEYHFEVMSQGNSYVYDANRRFTTPKE